MIATVDARHHRVTWPMHASAIAGGVSMLLGATVLCAMWFDVVLLVQPIPGLPSMLPRTAEWFVLLGASLLLVRPPHCSATRRRVGQAFALIVFVFAESALAKYSFGFGLPFDRGLSNLPWNAATAVSAGKIDPGTAMAFVMLSIALLTLDWGPAIRVDLLELFSMASTLIAMLALAGYVYGAETLYSGPQPNSGMAPHVAIGLLVLSIGVLCMRVERPFIALVMSRHAGGFVVRRLLVGVFAVPMAGVLVMFGLRGSLYDQPFAAALLAVAGVLVAIALVLSTGRALDRFDKARTAAERALSEREERLRDLIEHASDGVLIADVDGRYIEVNDAACAMLGYPREELIGKTVVELLHPDEVTRLVGSRTSLLKGSSVIDEWRLKRADGSYLPVEVSAKILPDGRWQALVRDISARQELERASDTVAKALTAEPQSSVQSVLHTIALEAQLVANAEYVALGLITSRDRPFDPWVVVGVPPEQLAKLGRPPRPLGLLGLVGASQRAVRVADVRRHPQFRGLPNDHPDITSFLGVAIRLRGRILGHLYLANKRGATEFTPADERAIERLAAGAATIIDTAYRYQAEGLERSWLQAVIDQMPEGVVLTDSTGATHLANRTIQIFGNHHGYELCTSDGDRVALEDQPMIRALVDRVTTKQREMALRHPDGRRVPMLVSAAPILDAQGQLSGVVTIFQDISNLKDIERLREEWSSVVAHDLRQPLNVIAIDTESLERLLKRGRTAEFPKVLTRIRESTKRLNRLIEDLLDVSLIEAKRLTVHCAEADLAGLLDVSVDRLSLLAPGHRVRLRKLVESAPVMIDATRIEQVLDNLVSNAAKYGEIGADITIALERHDADFEVAVISRGAGIAPVDLPRVFQRFARSERERRRGVPGLGLGLYICKGLIEAHGGRIWAESIPGRTTTFRFTIPAAPQSASAESESESESESDESTVTEMAS
jgi:PAS domain S-box-containing protein